MKDPKLAVEAGAEEVAEGFHPLDVPGFQARPFGFQIVGAVSTAQLLLDGAPVEFSGRTATVENDAGQEITITRITRLHDSIPKIKIDGVEYDPAPALPPPAQVWALVPLVFILMGGALGGGLGALGAMLNMRVMRGSLHPGLKFLACGAITVAMFLAMIAGAVLLQVLLNGR